MSASPTEQVNQLLEGAKAAHSEYERTVLNGVYDQDWAAWYAQWIIDHGLNTVLRTTFDAEPLGQLLSDINEAHQQTGRDQPWTAFTADRLVSLASRQAE